MVQHGKFTYFIVFVAATLFSSKGAFASHSAYSEMSLSLLFQSTPSKLGRAIGSIHNDPADAPTLTFKKPLELNAKGEVRLGSNCFVRNTTFIKNAGNNYFSSALAQAPGGSISGGIAFDLHLLSYQAETISIALHDAKGFQTFELSCSHPNIQQWSVSDFETSTRHQFHVRIPASLGDSAKKLRGTGSTPFALQELKGWSFNGIFGSGLPGTMGVQLLLGANLKAYAEETNAPLMVGHRCKLISQSDKAIESRYIKGAKFAFRESRVKEGKVEFVFDNWNHSPHQVRVECRGTEQEVKAMTVAEVEHDLNGIIQFYKK